MADFQDVLSNVMDRLDAWGKKSQSLGGKITLISSSLMSMPNFLVTHSLVPKKVLYEMEKLCRSFIWHKPNGDRSMHYVAWEELFKPRSMGCMGLQSPAMRVSSLRLKLAWDFFQKLYTLCHRTIKHKYGDVIMIGTHKKVASNAWKILLDGGRQLKNITIWVIGSGDKVNVLNDIWILDKCISRWPTFVDCFALEGMYVNQLLLNEGQWNYALLQEVFHPDLILLISKIQIYSGLEDRRELLRMYSSKSVSALSSEYILNCKFNMESNSTKKVEIFWWRLGKFAIPTNVYLNYHRIVVDYSCARGCNAVESYEHIMVHCKFMVEVLNQILDWGISIPVFHSLDSCLQELRRLTSRNSGTVKIYCTIVYLSWKNRNEVKHGKDALPSSVVASDALSLAITKASPHLSNWGTNLLRESRESWCPPPKDWMKINVDASLLRSNCAGIGGIFRDHKGRFILAFGKNRVHWDITKLELEAVFSIREYIRSWMLEYKGVIIESDNLNIIKFIQDSFKNNKWIVDSWPSEELLFFNDFHKVVFQHVHRRCNKEAIEEVLNGGAWYVGGFFIGLDKWTPNFSPYSLNGISSPIWVHLPHLPLHCWEETNITRIISSIGTPLLLDGNMFRWGRREFARACVRVKLNSKLPSGIWVEDLINKEVPKEPLLVEDSSYGPWMHVKFKSKRKTKSVKRDYHLNHGADFQPVRRFYGGSNSDRLPLKVALNLVENTAEIKGRDEVAVSLNSDLLIEPDIAHNTNFETINRVR
ncbi:uncharacterized protein LOC110115130 [Dendrobium catenatum]|uniref:uncharacterized protein LOC110115130 n=1 Tax=Dendrobium catenatum TaxID=906689 RepID=UPI0009F662C9|nr:uncharacterized protein LOC110115130 [Dendrobium catenatum]